MNPFMMYQQFMQNPIQMISKKYNLPEGMNNPEDILKHLVNSGQVSQNQIDNIVNNPMIRQFMGK